MRVPAWILLSIAAALWAGTFVLGRALRFDIPPVAAAFWRWAIALLTLLPLVLPRLRSDWPHLVRCWKPLAVLGMLATATHHVPLFVGLQHTTATNAALLYATSPIFIVLLAAVFLNAPVTRAAATGVALSFAGVTVITLRGEWHCAGMPGWNPGDAWVLLGTLSWAAYTIGLRRLPRQLDPLVGLAATAAAGIVTMLPLYAWELGNGERMDATPANIGALLYIGIGATVLGYVLWLRGVDRLGAQRAGPFMYLMTAFTPLLAFAFLDERIEHFHLIGTGMILTGVVLATRTRRLG